MNTYVIRKYVSAQMRASSSNQEARIAFYVRVVSALSAWEASSTILLMPLLQFIVAELDRELDRLHEIRNVVLSLSQTPAVVTRYTVPVTQTEALQPEQPTRVRHPRADAGRRRGPRVQKAPQEARALTATLPSGPVVISPARLAEERARREESREVETVSLHIPEGKEDFEALSRSLAARWSTGLRQ